MQWLAAPCRRCTTGACSAPIGEYFPRPAVEALAENLFVEELEDPIEGVVRGDAVGQFEKRAQERLLLLTIGLDLLEIVRPAHYGTESDDQNVKKLVPLAPIYTEIKYMKECLPVHQPKVFLFYYCTYFNAFNLMDKSIGSIMKILTYHQKVDQKTIY